MISDEELHRYEQEVEEMAGLKDHPSREEGGDSPDPKRIDRIVEKALYEAVVKDTASFVFNSFGSAIFGLTGAVMGHANTTPMPDGETAEEQEPTKPSRGITPEN